MLKKRILWVIFALLFVLTACKKKEEDSFSLAPIEAESEQETEREESTGTEETLYVYVCGAVNCEGVYELAPGSRVFEAVAAAGGFREDADRTAVNQAELLQDEARIYVPAVGEEPSAGANDNAVEADGKVNINKASKEQLMTLPGVGESRAEGIIRYREEQGKFQTIEDIMQISGIKEGLFEKIKDRITV